MSTRPAMFAGSWYPDNEKACERQIQTFLEEGRKWRPSSENDWIGGIVPHAGWYFSGSIACNVIYSLTFGQTPDVIALFGMHLHPNSDFYLMKTGAFETPLGDLAVAEELAAPLSREFKFVIETNDRFTPDNTIELQLPFIKYFFPKVRIISVGAPPRMASLKVGQKLVSLTHELGIDLKIIGSTDLTHYGINYGFTPKGEGSAALDWVAGENDRKIIELMLNLDDKAVISQGLDLHNACCSGAAGTAIASCKALGANIAKSVAYATSYEKSPGDSFVGYAGIVMGR